MRNRTIAVHGDLLVDVYNLTENDIHIETIAHSLAMQCRYNGHCDDFYSVASHSVLVSHLMQDRYGIDTDEILLAGLLHDASEAYLSDIPRPLKYENEFNSYRELENKITIKIFRKFGIEQYLDHDTIKKCDGIALATEAHQLFKKSNEWGLADFPSMHCIHAVDPVQSKENFMSRFDFLSTRIIFAECQQDVLSGINYAMDFPYRNITIKCGSLTYEIKRLPHVDDKMEEHLTKRKKLLTDMFQRIDSCNPEMFKG